METGDTIVDVGATVPTGFEYLIKEECAEKLQTQAQHRRGKVYFPIKFEDLKKVTTLRGVDNIYVVGKEIKDERLLKEKDEAIKFLVDFTESFNWLPVLKAWQSFNGTNFDLSVPDQESSSEQRNVPSFRVTCTRSGKNHKFGSPDGACHVGGKINDIYHWPVKMKNSDLDILVEISDDSVIFGIALTRESLHRRNITHFGPTTLRPTVAYGMLRLASPQPGDVVCDPMCGGASVTIEGACAWESNYFLSADINHVATERSVANLNDIAAYRKEQKRGGLMNDVLRWDVCNIPLKTNSVDIVISDIPFGKRMGSKYKNWQLYEGGLREMARVCRPSTGRAVLLTQDKKCMHKTLNLLSHLWRRKTQLFINLGGMAACVYLLQRCMDRSKYEGSTENRWTTDGSGDQAPKEEPDVEH
ncbi:THUMP domain-containing protein 3-like [Anneissia japonica]|uniref:THUMP domain-containing protein 3-like n=1 Tax=Anneissia japonica TaxID=1529436 RepID=UPI0014254E64|nr:THUMP domain-containing protein 3-like [Anneissia japonica]